MSTKWRPRPDNTFLVRWMVRSVTMPHSAQSREVGEATTLAGRRNGTTRINRSNRWERKNAVRLGER
jgi:hypothetical protein